MSFKTKLFGEWRVNNWWLKSALVYAFLSLCLKIIGLVLVIIVYFMDV